MRKKLFLIFIGVVVLSLASGLGLRYASAISWTEPSALPPGDNVPAPINVGSGAQIKTGDLTVGGNFSVGSGEVVGAPAGGNMGLGTLNAEQLCIQGNCRVNWPEAVSAFVDEGNIGFGPTAVLGTNDNVPLSFETNNVGRMFIDVAGNVGIGTAGPGLPLEVKGGIASNAAAGNVIKSGSSIGNFSIAMYADVGYGIIQVANYDHTGGVLPLLLNPSGGNVGIGTLNPLYKFVVNGASPREYLWATAGNPELDLGDGANHWAIYRDTATDQLRFWRNDNRLILASDGNVGIGISPSYKLDVAGQINASTNLTPAIQGTTSIPNGRGVYGLATNVVGENYGGYFEAAGDNGVGVYGLSSNVAGSGAGGYFQSDGAGGVGAYGLTSGSGGIGLYGFSSGAGSTAVSGTATSLAGLNRGGTFFAGNPTIVTQGDNNIGVMAAGGGSAGKNYGGYFKAQGSGYGVYSTVTDAGAWSGYFTGGQGLYGSAAVIDGNLSVNGNTTLGDAAADTLTFNTLALSIPNSLNIDNNTLFIRSDKDRVGIGRFPGSYVLEVGGSAYFTPAGFIGGGAQNVALLAELGPGLIGSAIRSAVVDPAAWAGSFSGGQGIYGDKLSLGVIADPAPYVLRASGDAYISGNLIVGGGPNIVYRCLNTAPANRGGLVVDYGGGEPKNFCGAFLFADTGLRVK